MSEPMHVAGVRSAWIDRGIALGLFLSYLVLLLCTVGDLGYSRDEGFYFDAARAYAKWFDILFTEPGRAFEKAVVDRYWRVNHEHPALIKSLAALSHKWLHGLPLIEAEGTSFRFPEMVLSALSVALTFVWARALVGRLPAFAAALMFGFTPRIFYHAHLNCFDMPVLSMWLVTSYAYWRSTQPAALQKRRWLWPLLAMVLYGLMLNTKHNSWILPFALVPHALLGQKSGLGVSFRIWRLRIPWALVWMATLSPLLFYCTWPWLWSETVARFEEYVKFHTGHVYYNMVFLGETYFRRPMPRLYAWVMTLATVPVTTLTLALVGGVCFWRDTLGGKVRALVRGFLRLVRRATGSKGDEPGPAEQSSEERIAREARFATLSLWALCILLSYAPWWFDKTPIFGGTKHWITAYPYLCLFAAVALERAIFVVRQWSSGLKHRLAPKIAQLGPFVLCASAAAPSVCMGLDIHPWGLTAYTPLVGGAPGAASLGLNRSFWGYTTLAVADAINNAPNRRGKPRVFVHDTAVPSFKMMMRDGSLKKGLRPVGSVASSDIALYHHEQHMSRVEFMIWVDYKTTAPAAIGHHDGVPVVWLYRR